MKPGPPIEHYQHSVLLWILWAPNQGPPIIYSFFVLPGTWKMVLFLFDFYYSQLFEKLLPQLNSSLSQQSKYAAQIMTSHPPLDWNYSHRPSEQTLLGIIGEQLKSSLQPIGTIFPWCTRDMKRAVDLMMSRDAGTFPPDYAIVEIPDPATPKNTPLRTCLECCLFVLIRWQNSDENRGGFL